MYNNTHLKQLVRSGYKATIIECGHGAEIANEILHQSGASDFLFYSAQPYSKEQQANMYQDAVVPYTRSVSREYILNALAVERGTLYSELPAFTKVAAIATSFQLDSGDGLTHGYLGISKGTVEAGEERTAEIYHISVYRDGTCTTKAEWISRIREELIPIIHASLMDQPIHSDVVDGVWSANLSHFDDFKVELEKTLEMNHRVLADDVFENFICITPQGELVRFEDIIRQNKGQTKGIVLQKGSFNPFHRMHHKIAQNAIAAYPDYPHALMISLATCDKGNNGVAVLAERIGNLTKLGYTVMVSKSGMFIENVDKISEHYPGLKVVFPVGEDTMERFFRDWEDYFKINSHRNKYHAYKANFKNTEWFISRRVSETKHFGELIPAYAAHLDNFKYSDLPLDDISSTKIRNKEVENII